MLTIRSTIYASIFLLFITSCQFGENSKSKFTNTADSLQVLPHTQADQAKELTAAELKQLSSAKGRTMQEFVMDDIMGWIAEDETNNWVIGLGEIFPDSTNQFLYDLNRLHKEAVRNNATILFIMLNEFEEKKLINTYLRKNQILIDVVYMPEQQAEIIQKMKVKWSGGLSSLWFLNSQNQIEEIFEEIQSYEELNAIVSPFLM